MNIYSIGFLDCSLEVHTLKEYEGKVILLLLSSTHSAFTPLYSEFEDLYKRKKALGFEILDFPLADFPFQCPENDREIEELIHNQYQTTFKRFHKIERIGDSELFSYLEKKSKFRGFKSSNPLEIPIYSQIVKAHPEKLLDNSIKWNFTSFLISKEGKLLKRFEPTDGVKKIERKLESIL